jgi:hypothetical protein
MSSVQRESVTVLQECIDLQKRKSQDYQNPNSNIVQSMHYRRGVSTIHDMISQKLLRAQSLLEAYENGEGSTPNFESLEDTYKDLINYASFAVSYIRGKMEGQDPNRDMLNRRQVTYLIKPPGGGTGTGREVTKEEFERLRNADTSGGSATGQVHEETEEDGYVTLWPVLLGGDVSQESTQIPLNESECPTGESRIKATYIKNVLPKGEVKIPRGETNCTDPVQHTYVNRVKSNRRKPKDIGDRMEGDFDELAKKKSER